ncbi:MAG: CheR family methyltransferase, partial [Bacteroidia bacterium]
YIAPPHSYVGIEKGDFTLEAIPKDEQIPYPINYCFSALAEEYEAQSIGIILSGTGVDGTEGGRRIKESMGMLMVQSPQSAQYDGMPSSMIKTGLVDFVLPPDQMTQKLLVYSFINFEAKSEVREEDVQQDTIRQVLQRLHQELGIRLDHLKPEIILRRIMSRQKVQKKHSFLEYINFLFRDKTEIIDLKKELLSSNGQFFREPEKWSYTKDIIIPEIALESQNKHIRVWVPACGSGEEAYSLAILFNEYMEENDSEYQLKIFASDIDADAIMIARTGIYPESIADYLSEELLNKYFIPRTEGYQVTKKLRDGVVFTTHDLIKDPPLNRMDLISCQNLLSGINENAQRTMMYLLNFSLNKQGVLILGQTDFPDNITALFDPIDSKNKIFRQIYNKDLYRSKEFLRYTNRISTLATVDHNSRENKNRTRLKLVEAMNLTLVEELDATCLLVNEQFELLKYFGDANRYLNLPNEPQNWNLLRMIPLDTAAAIRSGIRRSIQDLKSVSLNRLRFQKSGQESFYVDVRIRPKLRNEDTIDYLFLVLTESSLDLSLITANPDLNGKILQDQRIEQLEDELKQSRENLQSTIEELQTSNEELMTSNEELQSANEELQSVNEELYTMNAEFQATIGKISDLNTDIENLLQNSHIGTLFLDRNLCIRRFNSAIFSIFSLTSLDVGRPIRHFSHNLQHPDLMDDIEEVFEFKKSISREVSNQDGQWYLMHISPYLNDNGHFAGLVLNMVDISLVKDTEHLKEISLENQINQKQTVLLRKELEEVNSQLASENILHHSLWHQNPDFLIKINQNRQYKLLHSPLSPQESATFITSIIERLLELAELCQEGMENLSEKILIPDGFKIRRVNVRLSYLDEEHCITLIEDDTALYLKEQAFQIAQSQKQQLASLLPDISILFFDKEHKYVFSSGAVPAAKKAATEHRKLFSKEYHSRIGKAQKAALRGRHTEMDLDIEQEEFRANFYPLHGLAKQVEGGIVILNKVTDVNLVKRELESRLREMEQFAYAVSHDLKTPVRSITSFAQLLKRRYQTQLDNEGKEFIDFIVTNGQDMSELINGLLHFSLVGFEKEEAKPVPLNGLVDKVLQKLNVETSAENVSIAVEDLPVVMAHDVHLAQVFQNLIENALKFNTSEVKKVDVIAKRGEGAWVVGVKDNGIGISESYIDQIFVMFKQLHTKDKFSGSGIGLALCKKITERLGGRIWVESKETEGTTFYLEFPDQLVVA